MTEENREYLDHLERERVLREAMEEMAEWKESHNRPRVVCRIATPHHDHRHGLPKEQGWIWNPWREDWEWIGANL